MSAPEGQSVSPASTLHEEQEPFEPKLEQYEGAGTKEDPFIVKWRQDEKANPLNFREGKKWLIVCGVALSTLCVAFGSSIYSGGMAQMESYFGRSQELLTSGLSFYVLGFAIGPLLWAPISGSSSLSLGYAYSFDQLNRDVWTSTGLPIHLHPLYPLPDRLCPRKEYRNAVDISVSRWMVWLQPDDQFGCCKEYINMSTLRSLADVVDVAVLQIISDCFTASQRALGLALYALAPFMGPILGPIVGGFIAMAILGGKSRKKADHLRRLADDFLEAQELIFAGVNLAAGVLMPETYAPVLLRRRARKLSRDTGDTYVSMYDLKVKQGETLLQKLRVRLVTPFALLFREPIVSLLALYVAIIYGTLYGMFGGFDIIFQGSRHWKGGPAGLAFIGIGVGMAFGIVANYIGNKFYVRKLLANHGQPLPPEARLPLCVIGGVSLPIGLFWFAWTVNPAIHWSVDTYLVFAASALAANTVFRSLFGAAFPLFIPAMFSRLGDAWALTLLAFLTLAMAPVPLLFIRFGPRIRAYSSFAPGHAPLKLSKVPTRREEELQEVVDQADVGQREAADAESAWEKRHAT
ncbi:hypothetical protein P7C70_g5657, partial [Phenoliferia sp. Uapishka_3]